MGSFSLKDRENRIGSFLQGTEAAATGAVFSRFRGWRCQPRGVLVPWCALVSPGNSGCGKDLL